MSRRDRSRAEADRFEVGRHLLRLIPEDDGWGVTVDGLHHGRRYASRVEAWTAGLRIAEALDQLPTDVRSEREELPEGPGASGHDEETGARA